jgi:argininosuccinate synthase
MKRLLTRLEELAGCGRSLLLASGGLDSAYCMRWAAVQGLDMLCLHVDVGGDAGEQVDEIARHYGLEAQRVDARERFARCYVTPAIHAGLLYQGVYPVSSTLSRPLMAEIAVEEARATGAETIIHTAEPHQNSFNRFNISLALSAPEFTIGSPFLDTHVDRASKRVALERDGVRLREPVHSVDTNLWCRVIENGALDDSEALIPDSVFAWTRANESRTEVVEIEFDRGTPVALDGEYMTLVELLNELNRLAGACGVGRYNGFEQTPFGPKNHEVREAPAATVLLTAVRQLRQVSLPDDILDVLEECAGRWLGGAVRGRWFTSEAQALRQAIATLSEEISGSVTMQLGSGEPLVRGLRCERSLAIDHHPVDLSAPPSYESLLLRELPTVSQPRAITN